MLGRQASVTVLNLMKVLNQEITPARLIAEQSKHLFASLRID
jgi:hypothetical protein